MGWSSGPVLGIETSCDESSAAVIEDGRLRGHVIASQDSHAAFGGVVPEIAARAHLRMLDRVVEAAMDEAKVEAADLAGVGVTQGPGLVGPLLVGVNWAKAFAFGAGLPLTGVHHMEAHLYAASVDDPAAEPPFLALLVSGGHTLMVHAPEWGRYELLGETRDDAAGEAFDKVARRLGLSYPGGPEIEREARKGTPGVIPLPRPMFSPTDSPGDAGYLDLSFSGLKTAVAVRARELEEEGGEEALRAAVPDLAAEFQEAVVEVLAGKLERASAVTGCRRMLLGGGVARNTRLRERVEADVRPDALFVPPVRLATDNGAMIARLAEARFRRGEMADLRLSADPGLPFPGLTRGSRAAGRTATAGG